MPQRWFGALRLGKRLRERPERIDRYFDCSWRSAWGEERARVSSLSPTGCYIESRFSVPPDGETVHCNSLQASTHPGTLIGSMPCGGIVLRPNLSSSAFI